MNPERIKQELCRDLKSKIKLNSIKNSVHCNEKEKYKFRMLQGVCKDESKEWKNYIKHKCINWKNILEDDSEKHMPRWSWFVLLFVFFVGFVVIKYGNKNRCKLVD